MGKNKQISPRDLEEYSTLFDIIVITSGSKYSKISWVDSTKGENQLIISKWTPNMTIAIVNPKKYLHKIVVDPTKEYDE